MTSPARLAMIRRHIQQQQAYNTYLAGQAQLAENQAETYALAETDKARATLVAHWAEVNSPEAVRARAARQTRAKRRRQAAERGARTVVRTSIDMTAFEAQFGGVS